jgi:hypothetical protein
MMAFVRQHLSLLPTDEHADEYARTIEDRERRLRELKARVEVEARRIGWEPRNDADD